MGTVATYPVCSQRPELSCRWAPMRHRLVACALLLAVLQCPSSENKGIAEAFAHLHRPLSEYRRPEGCTCPSAARPRRTGCMQPPPARPVRGAGRPSWRPAVPSALGAAGAREGEAAAAAAPEYCETQAYLVQYVGVSPEHLGTLMNSKPFPNLHDKSLDADIRPCIQVCVYVYMYIYIHTHARTHTRARTHSRIFPYI